MIRIWNTALLVVLTFYTHSLSAKEKQYSVFSPDKKTELQIVVSDKIQFLIKEEGQEIVALSTIAMELSDRKLGDNPQLIKSKNDYVNEVLKPHIKLKSESVANHYHELVLSFKSNYSVHFRVFNEGIAYRFVTNIKGNIKVKREINEYVFPENYMCWWGREKKFQSHNQVYFDYKSLMELSENDLASLPLVLKNKKGTSIVIAETDLIDYPGLWLNGNAGAALTGTSPARVEEIKVLSDRRLPITKRSKYIAKTQGTRNFPWRIFAIANTDAELIQNQLTYVLAQECKIKDPSWIKPGKVAWDWWNANDIYGVDFEAGINTETYKYYIDFAAKYGLEYVMLDEGWYELGDITKVANGMDMEVLSAYAKEKNVGLILWCVWKTLDEQMDEAFKQFRKWGVKGIKVDFMNRDDQEMVNFYHKIAKRTAENKLLVDLHGSYKPSGLRRMYPNILTREGVNGGEQYKWSVRQTPEHNLITPFGRMLAGPMDYTPGAMRNAQEKDFKPIFDTPMSMGTRCHQLAMFVAYESPMQMLCESPTRYYKESECMQFLAEVPTVWDQTEVLHAKISDYLAVARKNGKSWYLGGLTDWDQRDLEIDFSFLPVGSKYTMTLYTDGVNANRDGNDFKQKIVEVDSSTQMTIRLAKGGGFAAMLHVAE